MYIDSTTASFVVQAKLSVPPDDMLIVNIFENSSPWHIDHGLPDINLCDKWTASSIFLVSPSVGSSDRWTAGSMYRPSWFHPDDTTYFLPTGARGQPTASSTVINSRNKRKARTRESQSINPVASRRGQQSQPEVNNVYNNQLIHSSIYLSLISLYPGGKQTTACAFYLLYLCLNQ